MMAAQIAEFPGSNLARNRNARGVIAAAPSGNR